MTVQTLLHPSVVALDGGVNFRDLGGNCGIDERPIKKGLLFRSGAFDKLSIADHAILETKLAVRTVLDYRDVPEANAHSNKMWNNVHYYICPANPLGDGVSANPDDFTDASLADFDGRAFMKELYRQLPFDNAAYRFLANLLIKGYEGALVQHCAVGKDRTGVGAALVLFALGASESTVIEDYLLTEITLAPARSQILAELAKTLNEHSLKELEYAFGAREEYITTALESIYARYSTPQAWLKAEFGLCERKCAKLQAYYLER